MKISKLAGDFKVRDQNRVDPRHETKDEKQQANDDDGDARVAFGESGNLDGCAHRTSPPSPLRRRGVTPDVILSFSFALIFLIFIQIETIHSPAFFLIKKSFK